MLINGPVSVKHKLHPWATAVKADFQIDYILLTQIYECVSITYLNVLYMHK